MADTPRRKAQPARHRRDAANGRCPICKAPTRPETRPFCSRRCADVDLGRWLGGSYRIPTDQRPGETDLEQDDEWGGGSQSGGHA